MPDEPLSRVERDIASIAAALPAGDPMLVDLADFADASAPTAVALLVNGMIVFGALGSIRAMAEQVDTHFGHIAEKALADLESPSDAERKSLEQLGALSTTKVDASERWHEKTREDATAYMTDDGFEFENAPAELSRRMILQESRHYLTVVDARILAPGQAAPTCVPVMRVAVAHVSGWWIVPADENGTASLQLWTGNQQER